ncbi:MAG: methionyl-tRNA formyltransferase [Candidatus Moranbacteria bacterium]|nr:methionyl-tRNA formyltransferase [Candidatus Moranbacteria bacterium]PIP25925.1 MAG: methionyl-tRNA formyltransferase [Candidatus Moranbacteria bacterium CG23_combo_of_CG06-09_8_20_14_all_41_28]PIV86157.1 MAG: methionyl-tRNA formyltransferase [Candidatus Moranbacteria bacterium CG17_big_fil_post_rev_8_21_14_2_50_41_107]PIW94339.1 MAG: methionyl-tRNA formyltransferase [Candidatus Moranbacteria bacterium CG_4_8_14_3_um_filter_41_13]PIX91604.1 MAG: methionyl-tRNA formyltransferase [Candidatus M
MVTFFDLLTGKKHKDQKSFVLPKQTATPKNFIGGPKIRTIFMGTPAFSAEILSALVKEKYNIVSVVTKLDQKVGRKQEVEESAIKKEAIKNNIPVLQIAKFDEEAILKLRDLKPDLIVVAAYGKILPDAVLALPGFGCINVHASLLPKFRGASPIQNALLLGETQTGISIMQMDAGMDTGAIFSQTSLDIEPEDTKDILYTKLTELGKQLLIETLPKIIEQTITPVPQKNEEATLCQLIEREDGHVMWTEGAPNIYNRYRALYPWPGLFSLWKTEDGLVRLKLMEISYQKQSPKSPHMLGEVFEMGEKIAVQTSEGIIFLEEVQLEGKSRVSIEDFLRGNKTLLGSFLQ